MVKKITNEEEVDLNLEGEVVENGLVGEGSEEESPKGKKAKIASVSVVTKDGQVFRTYTEEMHGKDFVSLAKDFADKKGLFLK